MSSLYWAIRFEIDEQVKTEISKGPISDEAVKIILETKVGEYYENWLAVDYLPPFDLNFETELTATYSDLVTESIESVFEKLPVHDSREKLTRLAALRTTRSSRVDACGLVFAGFGELDVLPCLKSYMIEGMRQRNPPIAREASVMKWRNEKKTSDWERSTATEPGGSRAVGRRV